MLACGSHTQSMPVFVTFVTAGFPRPDMTVDVMLAMEAGGADVILIPEHPITIEEACTDIQRRHERGKDFSIVVVSEGYELTYASGEKQQIAQAPAATDQFGHVRLGGVGDELRLVEGSDRHCLAAGEKRGGERQGEGERAHGDHSNTKPDWPIRRR